MNNNLKTLNAGTHPYPSQEGINRSKKGHLPPDSRELIADSREQANNTAYNKSHNMSTLASYSFLPWARQGIASRINEKDTLGVSDGSTDERATLKAELDIQYTGINDAVQSGTITRQLRIMGPGDILNFSKKNIVRTEPQDGVTNYEANSLPYVEFYEEDFLWRFTPASADGSSASQTRLRPWLALVTLRDEEFVLTRNPNGLPYITVKPDKFNDAFPHENDTWAFAHVQLSHRLANTNGKALQDEVSAQVDLDPDVAVSRLLCARKLQQNTGYTAFLVPAFETGRLTGLGIPITGVKAQAPAWKKGAMPASSPRPFDFPVYHEWKFRTAALGDFETLAAMLKPAVISVETGTMPMDISDPGFNLLAVKRGTKTIGLEAALKPPALVKDKWPTNDNGSDNPDDQETVKKLRALLNLSTGMVDPVAVPETGNPFFNSSLGDDPLLVPPVYGSWHAGIEQLGNKSNPEWIETLNLDFRNRAAAGLGKKVVQQHQEDFMNRAWQQVNQVNEANKLIQQAALNSMVNTALLKKHIINGSSDKAIMLTNPVQHLIKNPGSSQTVHQDFIDSRIPTAAKSAAFRKMARPNTRKPGAGFFTKPGAASLVARSGSSTATLSGSIFERFNADQSAATQITAAPPTAAASNAMQMNNLQQSVNTALTQYIKSVPDMAKDQFLKLIETLVTTAAISKQQLLSAAAGLDIPNPTVKAELTDWINNITISPLQRVNGIVTVQLSDAKFKALFGTDIHAQRYTGIILKNSTPLDAANIKALTTLSDLQTLQGVVNQFSTKLSSIPGSMVPKPFSAIESISKYISAKINPAITMTKKLASTMMVYQGGAYVPLQNLKPVMAHPEFTESVYSYLLQLSKNHILPNIDQLPDNSISLLENNQSFIEAFMVGLNHEMSRELLWREYPTDQLGSYFRQFWSSKDSLKPASTDTEKDRELNLDIRNIHEWDKKLGQHSPRAANSNVVILVRGSLLKKFPNTLLYAQQAEYDPNNPAGPRRLKGGINAVQTRFPLFKADIDPDITLMGFDLGIAEAKGERLPNNTTPTTGKNPGWFFVMKERPGQSRFGLDNFVPPNGDGTTMPPGAFSTWNDLSWEHLVQSKEELSNYHINFKKAVSLTNPAGQPLWGANSADLASILFQNPVLVARHAEEMLP